MTSQDTNSFALLWALGYRRLVPIVPPGAPLSPKSSLAARLNAKTPDDARGKAPGVRWPDGSWSGFDFVSHESDEDDLRRWHAMGAGVGIKTGRGLVLIDADTKDERLAGIIHDAVVERFGALPVRIGNYPKAGYLVRTDEDFIYSRVEFGERDQKGRLQERVEILAEGRQFVAVGQHPATGKPYRWPQGLPALADVPFVPAEALTGLLETLRAVLPAAGDLVREGAGVEVDQTLLRGDFDLVRRAVEAMPNTSEMFPTRESYLAVGYAIRAAAGPENESEAFGIFSDWAHRWAEGENDPDVVSADWGRMKPPYRRGASWLYEMAERTSDGAFTSAERWFETYVEPPPKPEPLFPEENGPNVFSLDLAPYRFDDPALLPRRQWVYGNHYIRNYVSTTAAPSAVGKSSLSIVEALAMASGKPLLGIQPKGVFRVWLWNGEDPIEEINLRIAAARMHYGLTENDIGDRLFVDSGREKEIVVAVQERGGVKIAEPVISAVVTAFRRDAIDVGFLDPFVSTYRGSETNELFDPVVKRWGYVAGICNASIELVHHTRKLNGEEATVESMRGGGALVAGARSKRVLAGMTKAEAKKFGVADGQQFRFFRVADARVNMALPAISGTDWYEMRSVAVGNGEGNTAVERLMSGDSVGVATLRALQEDASTLPGETVGKVVEALRSGEWRDNKRSNAWAGYAVADALGKNATSDEAEIQDVLSEMKRIGVIKVVRTRDKNGNYVPFVAVIEPDKKSVNCFD